MNSHEYLLANIETYEQWSSFKEIDASTLKQYANKLKSVGESKDRISTGIFKNVVMVAANRILRTVNFSLRKGEFPKGWILTTLIPIPKKPKTKKFEEFRPINTVLVYMRKCWC